MLKDGDLQPGCTGIRPRLAGQGSPIHNSATDFVIQYASSHGIKGLIKLFGMESPGLTASLALGEHVAGLVPLRCAFLIRKKQKYQSNVPFAQVWRA